MKITASCVVYVELSPQDVRSKDDLSSLSPGDTASVGSPWEKNTKFQKKKWRNTKKQLEGEMKFHEAMGLIGVDFKPVKPCHVASLKMPPLDPPEWFDAVTGDLFTEEPPYVGSQVP